MAEWKKEIKNLIKDFKLPLTYTEVIAEIENRYKKTKLPSFYRGNRNSFLYDKAYAKIKPYIFN